MSQNLFSDQSGRSYGTTYSHTQGYPSPTYPKHDYVQGYPPSTHPQQKEPSSAVTPPPTIDEDKDFPPDYMCLSVMLTVMALICTATLGWVFTIPAVVFSIMSMMYRGGGDLDAARTNSKYALLCNAACMIAFIILVAAGTFAGVITYLVLAGRQSHTSAT